MDPVNAIDRDTASMAEKHVILSINLADESLADFVDEKLARIQRETGEPPNRSRFIRDLIRADKLRDLKEQAQKRKARRK